MQVLELILQIIAGFTGILALMAGIPLFIAFRWPAAAMWGLKILMSALSPIMSLVGLFCLIVGFATNSIFVMVLGSVVFLLYTVHFISITLPPAEAKDFAHAFGKKWEAGINDDQKIHFLPNRTVFRLPATPEPRFLQNIVYAKVPGTNRDLLCDLWQPPQGIRPSGLGFIFLHGSAFYILDKDFCTRPLFRHLTAQGHVIMDVAYRLAPETDILGMVHDVNRAINWLKENAGHYGIDPSMIVIGGGSAGGHLAMLSAYTTNEEMFCTPGLEGKDTNVRGVISLYGTSDLEALYYHTRQHQTTRPVPGKKKLKVPKKMPGWMEKAIGKDFHRLGLDKDFVNTGTLPPLLGGHPEECPERYRLLSPIRHVHSDCPPTLLIHGKHDIMSPVKSTFRLYDLLIKNGVPVILHIIPQSDHGFDMPFPKIAPAAHNAIYDVERFLAYILSKQSQKSKAPRGRLYEQTANSY